MTIQTALGTNSPAGAYEQEADAIASRVLGMTELQDSSTDDHKPLPTHRVQSTDPAKAEAPSIVHDVLKSAGEPLDAATRAFMEPRFGHDFSRVRVHADAKAGESSRAVNALAYTVGEHIVFAGDRYPVGSTAGRNLLAHELAHVVQQHNGHVALQRQPDDRQVLADDLKQISEELEKMRQQVAEVAEDMEDFRWRLALEFQKLPKAESYVDANTPMFVEAAIETSAVLRPFLAGRLAKTTLEKKVKLYDFREEYESKRQKLGGPGGGPSIGQGTAKKQTYGFYHRRTDTIHLPPKATFGHALHEGIHKYSSVAIQNVLGIYINEGFTQFYTDAVLAGHSLGSSSHTYGPNVRCAKILMGWANNDKALLGRAYFQGDANALLQIVMRKLGIKTGAELARLRSDREGLGLCERIEKVGP